MNCFLGGCSLFFFFVSFFSPSFLLKSFLGRGKGDFLLILVCLVIPSKVVPLFVLWGVGRTPFLKGTFRFPRIAAGKSYLDR